MTECTSSVTYNVKHAPSMSCQHIVEDLPVRHPCQYVAGHQGHHSCRDCSLSWTSAGFPTSLSMASGGAS